MHEAARSRASSHRALASPPFLCRVDTYWARNEGVTDDEPLLGSGSARRRRAAAPTSSVALVAALVLDQPRAVPMPPVGSARGQTLGAGSAEHITHGRTVGSSPPTARRRSASAASASSSTRSGSVRSERCPTRRESATVGSGRWALHDGADRLSATMPSTIHRHLTPGLRRPAIAQGARIAST